jgi:hypothetical protein
MRPDAAIVDVQGGDRLLLVAELAAGLAAPGQKLRIVLDPVDEIEHLLRRTLDQHRFLDHGHPLPHLVNPVESRILALPEPFIIRETAP